jgi:hypothetical protein
MLNARWKGGSTGAPSKHEPLHAGQIRRFHISRLDPASQTIELSLA